jgi:hypothetical protein
MNKKSLFIIAGIILPGIAIGIYLLLLGQKIPENGNVLVAENFTVKLTIHDSTQKSLTINGDGSAVFTEGADSQTITVSGEKLDSLKMQIEESKFFTLEDKYPGSGCCDFVANTVEITLKGQTKTVYCYNQCPAEFDELVKQIKSLWPEEIKINGWV